MDELDPVNPSECPFTDITNYNFSEFDFPQGENDSFKPLGWEGYMKITFYVLALTVALLGNVGIILAVALNYIMRTIINIYLVNLAVADILICVCCMWVHLVNSLTKVYMLGPFMCKVNAFAQMVCLTSSVLTLSAISCDRFVAIMFPLHARITKKRTSAVITIIWLVSAAVSVPFLVYRKYYEFSWKNFLEPNCGENWPPHREYRPDLQICITRYPSKQLYYTVVTVTLFFLPVFIMATAYSLIIWRLWVSQFPGEHNVASVNAQHRAKRKVIKMVCLMLIMFVACWAPLQVIVLYSQFGHSTHENGQLPPWFSGVSYFATYLAYSNSALNPIIYGGFNKNFRQALCAVLRCNYRRQTSKRPLGSQKSRMTITTGMTGSPSLQSGKSKICNGGIEMKSLRSTCGRTDSCVTSVIDDTVVSTTY